jgi:ornithine cyclodeaminase/alanine dehydrogenase-like protein (mu-crystallin family)
MKILTSAEIQRLLTVSEAIDLIRKLFAEMGGGGVELQLRTSIALRGGKDTVLFMPGHVAGMNNLGVKIVGIFPNNPVNHNRSTISATILLNDLQTGEVMAVLDGAYITAVRTGAVSAVATDLLAIKHAHRLGVIGAGVQARSHIDAIRQVRAITDVRIFDVDAARTQAFVDALRRDHPTGCRFQAVTSAADAVVEADVVVTATTSSTPVFPGSLLKPGAHVNAIGAFQPGHRELDDDLMKRSRIFVDSRAEALAEAGDLIIPLGTGVIGLAAIEASLADLVVGRHDGRRDDAEITVFKAVGLAVEDIVVASYVFEKSSAFSVGTVV